MPIRQRTWPYPRNIKDIGDVNSYLKKLYISMADESSERLRDFENMNIGSITTGDIIAKSPWVDVRAYASFSLAIDAIGSTEAVLLISEEEAVADNKTVPANVTLKFLQGSTLNITAAKTVTMPIPEAGDYQIFEGAGSVVFSTGSVKEINPHWWGENTTPGTTDMTSALTSAFATLAGLPGGKLVIPDGAHLFDSTLAWTGSDTQLECRGTLLWDGTGTDTALEIGETGAATLRLSGKIRVADNNGSVWGDAKIGIHLIQLYESELFIPLLGGGGGVGQGGFQTGLKLTGDGGGLAYNQIHLGKITENKVGILFENANGGWANENTFYGGRFAAFLAHTGEWADSYHIKIPHDATNKHNNNVFIRPSFEQGNYECYYFDDGNANRLFHPRIEGSPTYRIYIGENAISAKYDPGYMEGIGFHPHTGYVDLGAYSKWSDRYSINSIRRIQWGTAIPTTGTYLAGDQIVDYTPVAGTRLGWICLSNGTFSTATDSTGDTDGSTAVITGMTDTSDFYVGEYVTVSAGFPSATTPYRIIAKTATTITLAVNSNAAVANVTVATIDPVFAEMGAIDLQGSDTWDPGNLVDGAGETSGNIAVSGAAVTDSVIVYPPYSLQGILCQGYVSAANVVNIRLQNETGGAIDLASGTWTVKVMKK